MLFKSLVLNVYTFVLYGFLGMMLWEVLSRRFLMEKIFSLILVFILLSFCLLLSGIEFLSLVILLLYVGAIAVLFLFVVMILNPDFQILLQEKKELLQSWEKVENKDAISEQMQAVAEQKIKQDNYFSPIFLGILFGLVISFNIFCNRLGFTNMSNNSFKQQAVMQDVGTNYFQDTLSWTMLEHYYAMPTVGNSMDMELVNIGSLLYTKYGIGVIIIGIMLLVAMMGAILLTLRQSPALKRQSIALQAKRYRFASASNINEVNATTLSPKFMQIISNNSFINKLLSKNT